MPLTVPLRALVLFVRPCSLLGVLAVQTVQVRRHLSTDMKLKGAAPAVSVCVHVSECACVCVCVCVCHGTPLPQETPCPNRSHTIATFGLRLRQCGDLLPRESDEDVLWEGRQNWWWITRLLSVPATLVSPRQSGNVKYFKIYRYDPEQKQKPYVMYRIPRPQSPPLLEHSF